MFYITIYIDEYDPSKQPNRQNRFTRSFIGYDEDGKIRASIGEFITEFMRNGRESTDDPAEKDPID